MILKKKAFTLIELLIVIAIIAILTVAFLPGALRAPAKARDAGRVKAINDIAAALESYSAEHNGLLPKSEGKGCLIEISDLNVLLSYFPNNTFPRDPNPVGNGACQDSDNKSAYFYSGKNGYYIVGALVEVAASANTSSDYGSFGPGEDDFSVTVEETLVSGGGKANSITPAKTPYYLQLGPK